MTGRLRRTLCVLSLAIWVAGGFLAVRGGTHADVVEWRRVGRVYGLRFRYDCFTAYLTTYPPGEVTPAAGFGWYSTAVAGPGGDESFYYGPGPQDPAYAEAGIRRTEAKVPSWFVMAGAGLLPTWRLTAYLVRRRRMLGSRGGGFPLVGGLHVAFRQADPKRKPEEQGGGAERDDAEEDALVVVPCDPV